MNWELNINDSTARGARQFDLSPVICNLYSLQLSPEVAHFGDGELFAKRIVTGADLAGGCNFIDYVEIPPGVSIGDHRHADTEEEFYLFLSGAGLMRLEDDVFEVAAGDLVRNKPNGLHGLTNNGPELIRLFVFELAVRRTR